MNNVYLVRSMFDTFLRSITGFDMANPYPANVENMVSF